MSWCCGSTAFLLPQTEYGVGVWSGKCIFFLCLILPLWLINHRDTSLCVCTGAALCVLYLRRTLFHSKLWMSEVFWGRFEAELLCVSLLNWIFLTKEAFLWCLISLVGRWRWLCFKNLCGMRNLSFSYKSYEISGEEGWREYHKPWGNCGLTSIFTCVLCSTLPWPCSDPYSLEFIDLR